MCVYSVKIITSCCFAVLFCSSYIRLYTWHIYHIAINNHNPTEGILLWRSGGACVVKWSWDLCWRYWCNRNGITCQIGQRCWPRPKGIPWSSRLGVGVRLTVSPCKTHIKSANHCYFRIHNHLALILLSWFIIKNFWQGHNESHCSVFHCSGLIKCHPRSCTGF